MKRVRSTDELPHQSQTGHQLTYMTIKVELIGVRTHNSSHNPAPALLDNFKIVRLKESSRHNFDRHYSRLRVPIQQRDIQLIFDQASKPNREKASPRALQYLFACIYEYAIILAIQYSCVSRNRRFLFFCCSPTFLALDVFAFAADMHYELHKAVFIPFPHKVSLII